MNIESAIPALNHLQTSNEAASNGAKDYPHDGRRPQVPRREDRRFDRIAFCLARSALGLGGAPSGGPVLRPATQF